jgi:hypothetical protein
MLPNSLTRKIKKGYLEGKTFLTLVQEGVVDFNQDMTFQFDYFHFLLDTINWKGNAVKYGIPYGDYVNIISSEEKMIAYFSKVKNTLKVGNNPAK